MRSFELLHISFLQQAVLAFWLYATKHQYPCMINVFLDCLFETKASQFCTSMVVASLLFWKCLVFSWRLCLSVGIKYTFRVVTYSSMLWNNFLHNTEQLSVDAKIYLAEWHLQECGCSECHCQSLVVNDAKVWQGESLSRFSLDNKTNTFLFSCGSKDISLIMDLPKKC